MEQIQLRQPKMPAAQSFIQILKTFLSLLLNFIAVYFSCIKIKFCCKQTGKTIGNTKLSFKKFNFIFQREENSKAKKYGI